MNWRPKQKIGWIGPDIRDGNRPQHETRSEILVGLIQRFDARRIDLTSNSSSKKHTGLCAVAGTSSELAGQTNTDFAYACESNDRMGGLF